MLVIDGKLTSKHFIESLPATEKPMPMIEPAIVLGLTDGKLFDKALDEYYAAINGAPLTKVMPIAFTSPLFGALMGIIFGAEPLTWKIALGTLLTIAGIVVLTV